MEGGQTLGRLAASVGEALHQKVMRSYIPGCGCAVKLRRQLNYKIF